MINIPLIGLVIWKINNLSFEVQLFYYADLVLKKYFSILLREQWYILKFFLGEKDYFTEMHYIDQKWL